MATTANVGSAAGGRHLRREVGIIGLTFVSLGSVIGSGWLLGALHAAEHAGPASAISWVIAAGILTCVALMYAELGSAYPVAGGTARFSFISFGPLGGFAAGWMSWLQAVALAPIEVEASLTYLEPKWSGLVNSHGLLTGKGIGIAIVFVFVFTLINLAGVRIMAGTNRYAVYWKIAIPLLTVVALLLTRFHGSNFTAGGGFDPYGARGIFTALPAGVVFALLGFEQAVQLGGEARNPQRDVPRAVIASMFIGVIIYLLLEVAFIGALNPANLVHGWASPIGKNAYGPYAQLATTLGLGWLAVLLYIDAVVSPGGTGLLYIGTTSRISYSMGRSRTIPPIFQRLDGRGIPWFSVLVASAFGILMFLPFGGWQTLVGEITSATAFMYAFAPVSVAALRRSDPDRPRPYRIARVDILAPLSFIFANLLVYWSGWPTDWRLAIGILIGVALLLVAQLTTPTSRRQPIGLRSAAWVPLWLGGVLALSAFGPAYVGSWKHVIPFWWDLAIVAVFSLIVFYLAMWLSLPRAGVEANLKIAQMETLREETEVAVGP